MPSYRQVMAVKPLAVRFIVETMWALFAVAAPDWSQATTCRTEFGKAIGKVMATVPPLSVVPAPHCNINPDGRR